MGLRARVAFVLAAAIIPISLGFSVWRIVSEHRDLMERRADRFAARLQRFATGECPDRRGPRDPYGRRRPHKGPRSQFVPDLYSSDLVPHGDAPPFPDRLRAVLQSDDPVHVWMAPGGSVLGATAVRIADEGECAVAVIYWDTEDVPPTAARNAALQTFGLAAVLAILGALVAFPIVRRIRRLEDAVRRAQHEDFDLEANGSDEIDALTRAFGETIAGLRAREQALEEYIANTTHDLAIPLTVLQHRLRKLAEADDSEDIRVALEESHYIAGLIANMRTAAKLETPDALDFDHDVDLREIVERVAQRHEPIAAQKGVELNFAVPDAPLVVPGEPTLIEQALSNLVQNAVQYNSAPGHVSVVLEDVDDGFELTVADDGPGIPDSLRERVMERGVRDDDARSRNESGQGFGLAIVRRVVTLHGWKIAIEHGDGLVVRLSG